MLHPDRPFAPARWPFFYGWVVLACATLGVIMSIPGQTMGVSVFSEHLLTATGLSRVGLANAYLVGTLTSGLMLPFGGRLLDRFGARSSAMGACVALALALLSLSRIDRFALWLSDSEWVMWGSLALAFSLLRFSAQGMLTLASRNMVPKWFERRRGLASGIFSVVVNLGFSFAPVALAAWIAAAGGWRAAWESLALASGLGMGLCAWLFYRDNPEECGLRMDGRPPDANGAAGAPEDGVNERRKYTLREALRSGSFWAVTLGISIQSALVTGVTFHIVDLGAEAGWSQGQAIGLFPPIAVISVIVGLLSGVATDHIRLRPIVFLLLLGESVGYLGLTRLDEPLFKYLGIVGPGVASGCFGTLTTVAPAKLFGRLHLGAISSAQMSSLVLFSALGPSLLALSRERFGSYGPALTAGAALPLVVAMLTAVSRDPEPTEGVW